MKHIIMKRLLIAGVILLSMPSAIFGQKEEKEKKDKKEVQQIIITRTGDKNEKTVVEINGDKVKINGKDADESKDVRVHINNLKRNNVYTFNSPGKAFSYNFDNDNMSLFSEDENRAMLGVATEGNDKGAEIQSVTKESAAEKAGLKKGDIITKI